jgi:hypothetical protein
MVQKGTTMQNIKLLILAALVKANLIHKNKPTEIINKNKKMIGFCFILSSVLLALQ